MVMEHQALLKTFNPFTDSKTIHVKKKKKKTIYISYLLFFLSYHSKEKDIKEENTAHGSSSNCFFLLV